ncbi:MAG: ComEA family DNA-binding protein [Clostridiales bacterium]|nr:ComEA family DNA-binding protein [Clostridiales bacterium]
MKKYLSKEYLSKEYLLANKTKVLKAAAVAAIVIAAVFVFFFKTGDGGEMTMKEADMMVSEEETKEDEYAGIVIVDVSGSVNQPQVVELPKNSRVGDAIDAAGGLTKDADISTINRAAVVTDGEKIYVPGRGETGGIPGGDASGSYDSGVSQTAVKVSINSASAAELETLSGVGPVTAQKIISYRTSNGRFAALEDLKNIDGIGDKTFEKLKPYITL